MCLLVYIASVKPVDLQSNENNLVVSDLHDLDLPIRGWLEPPNVAFVATGGECSCEFEHVVAEEPIEYFDDMFTDSGREHQISVAGSLISVVRDALRQSAVVELYAVFDDRRASPPRGSIELAFRNLTPEAFFFTEGFVYRIKE